MDRGGPAPSGCGLNCLVARKERLGALQIYPAGYVCRHTAVLLHAAVCVCRLSPPPPPPSPAPHTLMLTHLAGITEIGTCQNALRIAASDEAAAAVAAALPTTRAGPPGWRRRRVPRTGPGASAPGGRAGSGAAAAAAVAAALPTALAGPPGRPCREPRTDPGASARAPA